MPNLFTTIHCILPCCLLSAALLEAQAPEAAPAKPDSPAVQTLIEKAKKT